VRLPYSEMGGSRNLRWWKVQGNFRRTQSRKPPTGSTSCELGAGRAGSGGPITQMTGTQEQAFLEVSFLENQIPVYELAYESYPQAWAERGKHPEALERVLRSSGDRRAFWIPGWTFGGWAADHWYPWEGAGTQATALAHGGKHVDCFFESRSVRGRGVVYLPCRRLWAVASRVADSAVLAGQQHGYCLALADSHREIRFVDE